MSPATDPAVPGIATLSGTPDIAGQVREGSAALPIVKIVLVAELADPAGPGVPLEQGDEPVRRPRRDRAEEDRVHVADDHAVHADADTEGERDREGEAGAPPHGAERVSDVRAEVVEPARATPVPHRLTVPIADRRR